MDDVLAEIPVRFQDVPDQTAQESDVAARERMGTHRSAIALVREKRGSTWMIVAPFSLAFITQRKPTGCASAIELPEMRMQSAFARSCKAVVAPPLPKEVPKLGTVEECHIRAWLDTQTMPSPAVNSFLMR